MKRYTVSIGDARAECDGISYLYEKEGDALPLAEVRVDVAQTFPSVVLTPKSARRLRMLAAAPEMEELLIDEAKAYVNRIDWNIESRMDRIKTLLNYIETGEER